MKLVPQFEKFLADEVNLNKTRIKTLANGVNAIESFIRGADWKPLVLGFSPQGSWAHKTIIKPPGSAGFDADLLVFIQAVHGWTPKDYILDLRRVFNVSETYKDKLVLGNRCVTLEYSGDFSLDVVPCIVNRSHMTQRYEVCNRTDDVFEPTDGLAFAEWFDQRNAWVGNDNLRKVIRLLKYLRDVKTTFSCKSILLSTLTGNTVTPDDIQSLHFSDLPTAFRTLVARLDNYLQARPRLHKVTNPALPLEDFVRHWDDAKYENFREMIHKYRGWIDEAYVAPGEADSVKKWRRIFSDQFASDNEKVLADVASSIKPVAFPTRFQDAVQAVKLAGRHILANVPSSLPWVQPPVFAVSRQQKVPVGIKATQHQKKDGPAIGPITSGSIIGKFSAILFEAISPNGAPFGKDFDVQWRVVNTDHDAYYAHALRGGFYASSKPGRRWETTLYHGVHWVEAFVLRKRDRVCVGARTVSLS